MMPRLPVDGNKVVEHRITLGQYEREQLDTISTGYAVGRVAEPLVSLLSDVSALVALTSLLEILGVIDLTGWAWNTALKIGGGAVDLAKDIEKSLLGWVDDVKNDLFMTEGEARIALQQKIYNLSQGSTIGQFASEAEQAVPLPPGVSYWLWVSTNAKNGIGFFSGLLDRETGVL